VNMKNIWPRLIAGKNVNNWCKLKDQRQMEQQCTTQVQDPVTLNLEVLLEIIVIIGGVACL